MLPGTGPALELSCPCRTSRGSGEGDRRPHRVCVWSGAEWDTAAVIHMVTIQGLEASRLGWRAVPPVRLRDLGYPDDCRITMPGDALLVRRPDGSVLTGTVGMWGVDAWRDADG